MVYHEKQYRQKELEMNEFYNQHNLRLGYLNVKANVRHFVNSKVDSVKNCFRKIQDKFSKDLQNLHCLVIENINKLISLPNKESFSCH